MSLSVIVPVYNEEKHLARFIGAQIKGLRQLSLPFELIISENGSSDQTLKLSRLLAKRFKEVRVISHHEANYGLAVRSGFLAAKNTHLVLFDLDYWDIDFLRKALSQKADAVIASKNIKGSDQRPLLRILVSRAFGQILKLMFGLQLSDTHGIKLLKRKPFQSLIKKVIFNHEIFDTELLIRGQLAGLHLVEIGIKVRERRPSKTSIIKRGLKTLRHLWQLRGQLAFEGLL